MKLVGEYKETYKYLCDHLKKNAPRSSKLKDVLADIREMLYRAQKSKNPVGDVLGSDIETFCSETLLALPGFTDPEKTHRLCVHKHRKRTLCALVVVFGLLFLLWFFNIMDYAFYGMSALMSDPNNHIVYLTKDDSPTKIELSVKELEKNSNLLLYENGKCKIVLEYTKVPAHETSLFIRLKCFADYNLLKTVYYTPEVVDYFEICKTVINNESVPILYTSDGPVLRNYYIIDMAIPHYSKIQDEKIVLTFSGFIKHDYERTGWTKK